MRCLELPVYLVAEQMVNVDGTVPEPKLTPHVVGPFSAVTLPVAPWPDSYDLEHVVPTMLAWRLLPELSLHTLVARSKSPWRHHA